jgi:hypothetical protein
VRSLPSPAHHGEASGLICLCSRPTIATFQALHDRLIAGHVTAASAIGLDVNLFAQGHLVATRGGSGNRGGAGAHAECRTDYTIIASAPERGPACRLA